MNKIIRFLTAALCTIAVILTSVSPVIPAMAVSEETLAVIRSAAEASGVRLDPEIDAIAVKAVNDIEAMDASAAQKIIDAMYLAARIDPAAYVVMVNSLVCQANENALLLQGGAQPASPAPAAQVPQKAPADKPKAADQVKTPDPAVTSGQPENTEAAPAAQPQPPIQYIPGIVLTKTMGCNPYGPSGKEVYYNMDMTKIVARMKAMGYPGEYWVRNDGAKMLGDYVMCAAAYDIRPLGTLVESSLGTCIVVDTGGFVNTDPYMLDIAADW